MITSKPHNLEQTLDRIAEAEDGNGAQISVGNVISEVGHRSFGPFLLIPGVVTLLPIGGIPGLPSLMGLLVLIVSVQLLFGRDYFWLPKWLLNRAVARHNLEKSVEWMRRPARFIDRFLHPRLEEFTGGAGRYLIAALSVIIALMMIPMEFIPFSAMGAGLALTCFGLALLAQDGWLAVLGIISTLSVFGLVLFYFI